MIQKKLTHRAVAVNRCESRRENNDLVVTLDLGVLNLTDVDGRRKRSAVLDALSVLFSFSLPRSFSVDLFDL